MSRSAWDERTGTGRGPRIVGPDGKPISEAKAADVPKAKKPYEVSRADVEAGKVDILDVANGTAKVVDDASR